jgi:2,4-dienoyl-CoA reductase-like NADH-dependent reductase (Old Yellow Enzyme family)
LYDQLFEPLPLGPVTVPNRIAQTAHSTGHRWVDKDPGLLEYHLARARGGVGLIVLEIAGVHRSSPTLIPVYSDRVVAGYQKIAEAMRPLGTRVFQQLWHGGNAAAGNPLGGPTWSASDIPNPATGSVPVPMTHGMIDELVHAFGAAARRARDGGLDGVEVHAAHGYLIGQFLSPATNRRQDRYGGSPANRARLLVEILTEIRRATGPDFAVGARLSADEQVPGGITPPEAADTARLIEPLIDYLDVSMGSYYRLHRTMSPMDDPLGYELPTSQVVTRAVDVPTIVAGRIMSLDQAHEILKSGAAEMVSMVRALIADPELIRKYRDGRSELVRPCVSINQGCVGGLLGSGRMTCVVNPRAGRESVAGEPTPALEPKNVVVVGGGPAGLEAARTAALRGHSVQLFEMTGRLGGQVAIAASAPHRKDIGAITEWLAGELRRLDVRIRLSTPADPDTVLAADPDEVIVATGSSPRRDGRQRDRPCLELPGADLPHVVSSWDLFGFGGRARVGDAAVVYDDTGGFEAISVAEELQRQGAAVTFITRHPSLGAAVPAEAATVLPARARLQAGRFRLLTSSCLTGIGPAEVTYEPLHGGRAQTCPADSIVFVGANQPNRELADELAHARVPVHLIGDAAGGNTLQAAIHQAVAVASAI